MQYEVFYNLVFLTNKKTEEGEHSNLIEDLLTIEFEATFQNTENPEEPP
jgi:hypothetical protein